MNHLFIVAALGVFSIGAFGQSKEASFSASHAAFGMVSITGKSFGREQLNGKVVVLNFWYTSCPPCLKEIPELNELVQEYSGKGVVFLALATDGKATLDEFLKEHPFDYEIIPSATQTMFKFLEPEADLTLETKFPTHIVVDRDSKKTVYATGIKGIAAIRKELKRLFPDEEL